MRAIFPFAFALALTTAAPAFAQEVVVPIDHSVRLSVRGQAASVVVGNPGVADVTVVDSHTLFVSGRGYGETDVVVLDHNGRTIYSGDVLVGATSGGRASVYRGAERTDFACAPVCSVTTRSPTDPSKAGAAPAGGGTGANPIAGLAGTLAGSVAGGLSSTMGEAKPG